MKIPAHNYIKRIPTGLLLILLFGTVAQPQAAVLADQSYIYEGRTISKEYFDAINSAREALPLIKAGDYTKAEPIMKQAAAVASDDPNILLNYALILSKVGKPKEAIDYYHKAAVLNPKDESPLVGMASAYGALGQFDESLKATQEFLKRFPNSPNFATMSNQATTIEKEMKRLSKSAGQSASEAAGDNYVNEAIAGQDGKHIWKTAAMPVPVYLEAAPRVDNWRPELNQIMRDAFEGWAAASNGNLSFKFVDDRSKAKITCDWTNDLSKLRNPAENGDAHIWWIDTVPQSSASGDKQVKTGEITQAVITMATKSNVNPGQILTDEKIRQTALHEIGHSLGIGGHSPNPSDIMYFANTSVLSPTLTARDKKTLELLYAQPLVKANDAAEQMESEAK